MFQKGIHDACHADVVAVLLPGDEAADAADNEVYLYTGLRGFVEAVYQMCIRDSIRNPSGPAAVPLAV